MPCRTYINMPEGTYRKHGVSDLQRMPYRTYINMPEGDLQKACRIGLTANAVCELPTRDLREACQETCELPTRDMRAASCLQETCELPTTDMRAAHKGLTGSMPRDMRPACKRHASCPQRTTLVWHAGYLENDTEVQRISENETGHRSGSAESRPHGTHSECHNRTYMNMPARDMQKANQEGQTLAW